MDSAARPEHSETAVSGSTADNSSPTLETELPLQLEAPEILTAESG